MHPECWTDLKFWAEKTKQKKTHTQKKKKNSQKNRVHPKCWTTECGVHPECWSVETRMHPDGWAADFRIHSDCKTAQGAPLILNFWNQGAHPES